MCIFAIMYSLDNNLIPYNYKFHNNIGKLLKQIAAMLVDSAVQNTKFSIHEKNKMNFKICLTVHKEPWCYLLLVGYTMKSILSLFTSYWKTFICNYYAVKPWSFWIVGKKHFYFSWKTINLENYLYWLWTYCKLAL